VKIFYAAGPGNVIQAHKRWKSGKDDPSEMSLAYSSQFADFCRDVDAAAYIVSYHPKRKIFRDGRFVIEHRPKPMLDAKGVRYHLAEAVYALNLVLTAIRFKADVAVISSGSTHYFLTSLFRIVGIRLVTVLHNTLWPANHPPTRLLPRIILRLDSLFFRWASTATLGVSPECTRQVDLLTKGRSRCLRLFWPQFHREYFEGIPPPPPHSQRPFRIMYAGAVARAKGVFDILELARRVEARTPQCVAWEICGSGPELDEFKRQAGTMGLRGIMTIHGWTAPRDMRAIFGRSHASIVPTRSTFTEGMAKTAVEAILAGRPVITSSVVPALEVLKPGCIEARTDDVDSYEEAILNLISNENFFRSLCKACGTLEAFFYNREHGFASVLRQIVVPNKGPLVAP
jgi:glycogen synthase